MNDIKLTGVIIVSNISDLSPKVCFICGSTHFISDSERGEVVCEKCGLVIEDKVIARAPEWKYFQGDTTDGVERATPISKRVMGTEKMQNTIIGDVQDGKSRNTPPESVFQFKRLRTLQRRTGRTDSSRNRSMGEARRYLTFYIDKLNLPKHIYDQAAEMYIQAIKTDLLRGRTIDSIVSACLYMAIRNNDLPYTLDDITKISTTGLTRKRLGATFRFLITELNMKPVRRSPLSFMRRYINANNLTGEYEMIATSVATKMFESMDFSGSNPRCVAACALYIAGKQMKYKVTQTDIAKMCGITEVSLRNNYRRCEEVGII